MPYIKFPLLQQFNSGWFRRRIDLEANLPTSKYPLLQELNSGWFRNCGQGKSFDSSGLPPLAETKHRWNCGKFDKAILEPNFSFIGTFFVATTTDKAPKWTSKEVAENCDAHAFNLWTFYNSFSTNDFRVPETFKLTHFRYEVIPHDKLLNFFLLLHFVYLVLNLLRIFSFLINKKSFLNLLHFPSSFF